MARGGEVVQRALRRGFVGHEERSHRRRRQDRPGRTRRQFSGPTLGRRPRTRLGCGGRPGRGAGDEQRDPRRPGTAGRLDLDGVVITMDALHTQHDTATLVTEAGGDYVLTVKANQKSLFAQLKALPWTSVPAVTRTDRGHGRRATRTIKVVDVPAWIDFSGAVQVAQLRRTVTRKSRRTVEIVHLITSADATAARRRSWPHGCSRTGRSRTACTGSVTSPSTRTAPRSAPGRHPASWRASVTPRSPCSAWTATTTSLPPYGIAHATPTAPSTCSWRHDRRLCRGPGHPTLSTSASATAVKMREAPPEYRSGGPSTHFRRANSEALNSPRAVVRDLHLDRFFEAARAIHQRWGASRRIRR